jgi:hypothetical protein
VAVGASLRYAPGLVEITEGEEHLGAWTMDDEGWDKLFCRECGSHMFSRDTVTGQMGVRMSALDGEPPLRPQYRQFTAYAAVWEPIPEDGLPRYPERAP